MSMMRSARPSRRRRWRAVAAIAVLAILAGACGDDDDSSTTATATFEGGSCVYDGPSEFPLDTEATFTVMNATETNNVGFGVWKVPDGTTTTDITDNSIFGIGANQATDMRELRSQGSNAPDVEHEITVALDTPGTWVLNCYTAGGLTGLGTDYPATTFTVTHN